MGYNESMTRLADAVRAKSGATGKLTVARMTELVNTITSGGGGGGTAAFYKCVSVDKNNNTWSGYKAVLSSGVYTFENSVTEGLTCGTGFTPKVNEVYSIDALIHVKNLYDGSDPAILLEVSFANSNRTPAKGSIDITGEYEANSDGLFFYNGDIGTDVALEDIADEFTIYCEVKTNNEDRIALFAANDDDCKIGIDTHGGTWNIWAGSDWWNILEADSGFEPDEYSSSGRSESYVRYGEFQKIVFTHSGDNWDLYVDGVNVLHRIRDGRIRTGGTLRFNRWGHGGFTGYDTTYKTILVLQRALTADEVATL
jgi:hypothetical protein